MSTNSVRTQSDPEQVFAVLDDAHAYPRWVVGARRVRNVDVEWPAVGSRFHHAVGTAAGEVHDSSKVLERDRPFGVARVDLDIEAEGTGSIVSITEHPTGGPFALLPRFVSEPLLRARNALALQRFGHLADSTRGRTSA